MIINTGQRTDIPAFYSRWFMNRIRDGLVYVRNPYNPKLVMKYLLTPEVVDIIGFCTKNPRPMLEYMDELSRFKQLWYITITAFGTDFEPYVPPISQVIDDFKRISTIVGKDSIVFRYTPIIINDKYTVDKHIKTFRFIVNELKGYTSIAVFGFLDLYNKLKNSNLHDCSDEEKIIIAKEFLKISKMNEMYLRLCSKEKWLKNFGIDVTGCMRLDDFERSIGSRLLIKNKASGRKDYCSCYLSNDIGAYNSCLHFCSYCYANGKKELIIDNYKKHDVNSPLLIGNIMPDDKIIEVKQESNIVPTLFDLF